MRPTDASSSPHATSVSTSRFDTLSAKIAVVEARAPPTVHVVAQAEIWAQTGARDLAGARGVRFQQNFLFYTEEFVWPRELRALRPFAQRSCYRDERHRRNRAQVPTSLGRVRR